MTKAELIGLLREAQSAVAYVASGPYVLPATKELRDRIYAALKDADTPVDGEFAEGEGDIENAEWIEHFGGTGARPDDYTYLEAGHIEPGGYWYWAAEISREARGRAKTLEEAKAAARAAARKLR